MGGYCVVDVVFVDDAFGVFGDVFFRAFRVLRAVDVYVVLYGVVI